MADLKVRTFPEHNYRALHFSDNTLRIALDPSKPITTLSWPEFYDVKVTSRCTGGCGYCYQRSSCEKRHVTGVTERFESFFGDMDDNRRPFQIAFGGGEPTSHPEFETLLRACVRMGITPNYTTNGVWDDPDDVIRYTQELCGGVAVSTHPHLERHWRDAVNLLLAAGVHTNLHVIIGGQGSIDAFSRAYEEFTGRVKHFVLLPLAAQGRSRDACTGQDWDDLCGAIKGSPRDVAFGANFHPYLCKDRSRFKVSLYDPESMSAYLDLETMRLTKSSFSDEARTLGKST